VDDEGMQEERELVTEFCIRGGMMKVKKNENERDGKKTEYYINRASICLRK
jgi:hypothetical protein